MPYVCILHKLAWYNHTPATVHATGLITTATILDLHNRHRIVTNLPSFLSSKWFGAHERDISTAVIFLFNMLGVFTGYIYPFTIMKIFQKPEQYQEGLIVILCTELGVTILVLIIVFLFAQDKPKTPPSKSENLLMYNYSTKNNKQIVISVIKDTFGLFANLKTVSVLFIYGLYHSNTCIIATFLCEIIDYFNADEQRLSGYIGATSNIMSAIGTIFYAVIVGKLGHKWNFRISGFVNLICSIVICAITAVNYSGVSSNLWMFLLYMVFGFHSDAFLPLGYELLANISYPVEANLSSNAGSLIGNILGATLVVIFGKLENRYKYLSTFVYTSMTYLLNSIVLVCVKYENKRQKAEE
ncbi:Feline leukemia virus subgroup C receptor-related protein 2 [Thelohanellus kitauei]|uniref:Feline leukemia virus subgroup C receptor-related protein 2 n=1 Tax=Thelohanellus kitauei TaxID=669202 RepID=A0A0C2MJX9_THEKT|nr:Feline leukemia virus subgroup C receptor-related protein 2 [Thelohanellus kitauei]